MVNEKYTPFINAYQYSRRRMGISRPKYGYRNDDICNYLTYNTFLNSAILSERKEDRVIGFIVGPPCPDFSTVGKNKGASGENGKLSKVYFKRQIKH